MKVSLSDTIFRRDLLRETERGSYMGQVVEIGNDAYQPLKATTIHSSASNFNIEVYAYENSSPVYLKYVDVKLLVRKLV